MLITWTIAVGYYAAEFKNWPVAQYWFIGAMSPQYAAFPADTMEQRLVDDHAGGWCIVDDQIMATGRRVLVVQQSDVVIGLLI